MTRWGISASVALEILDFPLVFLRGGARIKGAEIASFAGLWVIFLRVKTVFAVF